MIDVKRMKFGTYEMANRSSLVPPFLWIPIYHSTTNGRVPYRPLFLGFYSELIAAQRRISNHLVRMLSASCDAKKQMYYERVLVLWPEWLPEHEEHTLDYTSPRRKIPYAGNFITVGGNRYFYSLSRVTGPNIDTETYLTHRSHWPR